MRGARGSRQLRGPESLFWVYAECADLTQLAANGDLRNGVICGWESQLRRERLKFIREVRGFIS